VKSIYLVFCLLLASSIVAADPSTNSLSHRLSACETEMEMLKNSIATQEESRESLEKEVSKMLKAAKDAVKDSSEQSGTRQKNFDKTLEKLTSDLKQLKTHCNDLSSIVNDLSKTVAGLKEGASAQNLVIKELEQAMRGLTLALGGKGRADGGGGVHVVKNGDSLEKIARQNGMSISELKELNNLKSSTIHPGQELIVRSK
jgi:septal ring factor EnvC (AmiA/AmiB activator)